jgi:hypothetical protein
MFGQYGVFGMSPINEWEYSVVVEFQLPFAAAGGGEIRRGVFE